MSRRPVRNVAASVRQRLLNYAREHSEDFQLVLTRYVGERFLYRLSKSAHAGQYVLKGATLFTLWGGDRYRPTRDLDLLGRGSLDIPRLEEAFREVCRTQVEDDGLRFQEETVQGAEILEAQDYPGIRTTVQANLGRAGIKLQVDIGFGDAVTPAPKQEELPRILADVPAARLKVYPRETMVAEKFEAMVKLGIANSRMRDFYDIWTLARRFLFKGRVLSKAIERTFRRRKTGIPIGPPLALTAEFYDSPAKVAQWTGFLRRSGLANQATTVPHVAGFLKGFLVPPTLAISRRDEFNKVWPAGGPWRLDSEGVSDRG